MAFEGLTREQIERRFRAAEEAGLVDLDAPLRDALPELAKHVVTSRSSEDWWIIAEGADPHAVCECPSTEKPR